ncbi:unnamed protein product [Effrenium voratum]|nr:unnamed protein product [Effrenium voratum]
MPPRRRSWSLSRADGFSTLGRGTLLAECADQHGVEMDFIPAESHGMIGQVERGIGVLKDRMIRHLRSSEGDPREAAWAMVTAHNGLARVGKYSPQQCVFGRNFTDADRLHDGQGLPFWSSVSSDERMRKTLEIRTQAETSYRKATVEDKISRARNSQSRPVVKYYTPGTWSSTGGINNLQMHEAMPDLMFLGCVWRGGVDLQGAKQKRRKFGSRMASVREGGSDRAARSAEMSLKPTNLRERTEEEEFFREIFAAAWWTMRRHELEDRPQHVPEAERDVLGFVSELQEFENIVFAVILPEPKDETEWKAIVKDHQKFMKKVAKGVEVSWQRLSLEQRAAMKEAKGAEINEWLSNKVVRAAIGNVPPQRLMKMRWVLTFKNGPEDGTVKAKARLVVLGYSDPDAGYLNTKSPMMTRRSRQLLLQMAAHRGWRVTIRPTLFFKVERPNFSDKFLDYRATVQFLKATYGLTVAPREWFLKVDAILTEVGLSRLKTEPCMWSLKVPDMNREDGKQRVLGLISAHMDDFLITGDESDERWNLAVKQFHAALKWSPWEEAPMMHCGVQLQQLPDGGWLLDQEEYCSGLSQVTRDGTGKELTENERSQARAVLGAVQWRVYQSGPQHAAKLSHLQSVLPRGDSTVLGEINKLVREVYGQKDTALRIFNLNAKKEDDLVVVGGQTRRLPTEWIWDQREAT